jgi:hypothetical protein
MTTYRYAYQLVSDPDSENGLLIPDRNLILNYAEIRHGLEHSIFTPGSVLRHLRRGRQFQVVQAGHYQSLVEMQ